VKWTFFPLSAKTGEMGDRVLARVVRAEESKGFFLVFLFFIFVTASLALKNKLVTDMMMYLSLRVFALAMD
jgi:hypothetical protein